MTACSRSFTGLTVLSAVLIALAAPAALAQVTVPVAPATPAQSAFLGTAFSTVASGREVWITTSNGSRMKVRVGLVGPTGLSVTETSGRGQTVRFEEITRIQKVQHRLRTGTIVGLAVGAGLGALAAATCGGDGDTEGGCVGFFLLTYAGIGAGIGALAGAIRNHANRDDDAVYVAGVRTTTVAFAPILSRTRKGATLSITWR